MKQGSQQPGQMSRASCKSASIWKIFCCKTQHNYWSTDWVYSHLPMVVHIQNTFVAYWTMVRSFRFIHEAFKAKFLNSIVILAQKISLTKHSNTQWVGTGPGSLTIVFIKLHSKKNNSRWYTSKYTTMPNVAELILNGTWRSEIQPD